MIYTTKSEVPVANKELPKSTLQIDPWLVAVLACYTLFAWASWGKIQYAIWDVGREVEIPTRILAGQVLYRDVETFYGPLAYYANALVLLVFGQHLQVFYAIGLSLTLVATLLFYRLARRLTNARWAALSTVYILIQCALSPGLFNFIMPYSYGGVYATVLCLIAIASFDCYAATGKVSWLVAAAIACGGAGIAKQEYGVAALVAVLVGIIFCPQSLNTKVKHSIILILVASACAFLPLFLLAQFASWEQLQSSLMPVSKLSVLNRNTFFQVSPAKTLHIWLSSFKVFLTSSVLILVSLIITRWSIRRWFNRYPQWLRNLLGLFTSLFSARLIFSLGSRFSHEAWDLFPLRDLSWFIPVLVGWFAFNRPQLPQHKNAPLLWTLLIFSLLLNARWLFYINFYGLYAWSVALLFFTILYYLRCHQKLVWHYLLICLLMFSNEKLGELSQYRYAVQSPYGNFSTINAGLARAYNQTINAINVSQVQSLLVLPECSILTFMTGTYSPSRIITFQPIALADSHAEEEFIASMKTNPPEMIVYVDMPFREMGYKNYADFNPLVDRWITQEHKLIHTFPSDEGAIRIYTNI